MGLRESHRVYLSPPILFHPPKPKINEKMGDLSKLDWSRDVTEKVDNIHSNLTQSLRTTGLPIKIIKIYNIRVTDVVCEVKYFWNGWVKKNGVNTNLV